MTDPKPELNDLIPSQGESMPMQTTNLHHDDELDFGEDDHLGVINENST